MVSILATFLVLGLGQSATRAQNPEGSVSLGDLARQIKAQRAPSPQKTKVFTNDDLSTLPPTNIQPTAPSSKTTTEGKTVEKEPVKTTEAKADEKTHGEKYYRAQMGKLQDRLEIDRRELRVLEQKLGQNQMQYYPDPQKGLLQESGPTARSDIYKLQDQIAKKKADIATGEEAIENLREQLRHEGGDPAWVR